VFCRTWVLRQSEACIVGASWLLASTPCVTVGPHAWLSHGSGVKPYPEPKLILLKNERLRIGWFWSDWFLNASQRTKRLSHAAHWARAIVPRLWRRNPLRTCELAGPMRIFPLDFSKLLSILACVVLTSWPLGPRFRHREIDKAPTTGFKGNILSISTFVDGCVHCCLPWVARPVED